MNYPAGLRVNARELENGVLNIGYGMLHNHLLYPEIAKPVMIDGEAMGEQGMFTVNANQPDSLQFYKISDTGYFNYECDAYFSWEYRKKDTTLILYRPNSKEMPEMTTRYKRIARSFEADYPAPNPIYYFTRRTMLAGNFWVKDSLGRVVCEKLSIGLDGKIKGYAPFENHICYYNTEVYCGPHETEEIVLICTMDEKYDFHCKGYYYKRQGDGFQLLKRTWREEQDQYEVGPMLYHFYRL